MKEEREMEDEWTIDGSVIQQQLNKRRLEQKIMKVKSKGFYIYI